MKTINLFCDKALPILYAGLVVLHAGKEKIGWATAAFFIGYTLILRRPQ